MRVSSILFISCLCRCQSFSILANSPAGIFAGYELTSYSGRPIAAFSGIRYAQPPVGRLRFQDPVSYEYGTGSVVSAIKEGSECLQLGSNDEVAGSEDCLYLNVYSSNITGKTPVVIYIHGGAFSTGSGTRSSYGPEYFLDQDLVLITFNYRLGVLGYASTEDEILPGNWGQKDQIEAINWVSKNIRAFGGDPTDLTLFGQSTGAASTMYNLKMAPVKYLIKKAIVQSGSLLAFWATSGNHLVRNKTLLLSEKIGCPNQATSELVDCLRIADANTMLKISSTLRNGHFGVVPFRIVTRTNPTNDTEYLPSLSLLTGFVEMEGVYFGMQAANGENFTNFIQWLKENFTSLLPHIIQSAPSKLIGDLANKVANFYWGGNNASLISLKPVVEALGDIFILSPVYLEALRHNGDLYTYSFNYSRTADCASRDYYGPTHGDELKYLFKKEYIDIRKDGSANDREVSIQMVNTWTDFVKGRGSSSIQKWGNISKRGGFLDITSDGFTLINVTKDDSHGNDMAARLGFWSDVYSLLDV